MILKDPKISQAVASISQRAERQKAINKLVNSYVEVGILPQLLNTNNQILFGRRGTGKTHILRILETRLKENSGIAVCYIDGRTLGSSPQFTDQNLPINYRCGSLFIDILNEISYSLLDHIAHHPNGDSDIALEALDNFNKSSVEEIKRGRKVFAKHSQSDQKSYSDEIGASIKDFKLSSSSATSKTKNDEKTEEFLVEEYKKIIFPELHHYLQKTLQKADNDLYIIIDEWSAIPLEIQPFLAEFLKKSFIAIPEVSIKIGALEYRSNFTIPRDKHNYIGFELGSDISANLDIDDYYVFDRNPDKITDTFVQILHKHLKSELEEDYLKDVYDITTDNKLLQQFFTGKPAFRELVRASEGVIRDFINIFTLSFFDAQRSGKTSIEKRTIIESSQQWFERDKSQNLDSVLESKLRLIVDEVIGKKKARSFMVSKEVEKHEIIQKLFDARVIHFVKRGYSDKDNPGVRYNIYSLDYGTYVDLINTSKEPQIELEFSDVTDDDIVIPFDDNRSIRRIILSKDQLED